jgi:hypothetical protein
MLRCDLVKHGLEFIIFQHIEFYPFDIPPYAQRRLLTGDEVKV